MKHVQCSVSCPPCKQKVGSKILSTPPSKPWRPLGLPYSSIDISVTLLLPLTLSSVPPNCCKAYTTRWRYLSFLFVAKYLSVRLMGIRETIIKFYIRRFVDLLLSTAPASAAINCGLYNRRDIKVSFLIPGMRHEESAGEKDNWHSNADGQSLLL